MTSGAGAASRQLLLLLEDALLGRFGFPIELSTKYGTFFRVLFSCFVSMCAASTAATATSASAEEAVPAVEEWRTAVDFAALFELPPPTGFLRHCAGRDDYLLFVYFAQRFGPIFFCFAAFYRIANPT